MMKKNIYLHLEKTLSDTNWSQFGEIIGIGIAVQEYNKYILSSFLINENNIEQRCKIVIDKLYEIRKNYNIYSYGGTQYFYSLLAEKSNSDEYFDKALDLALESYDFHYSIYKNLGFCISFNSILDALNIDKTDLILDQSNV